MLTAPFPTYTRGPSRENAVLFMNVLSTSDTPVPVLVKLISTLSWVVGFARLSATVQLLITTALLMFEACMAPMALACRFELARLRTEAPNTERAGSPPASARCPWKVVRSSITEEGGAGPAAPAVARMLVTIIPAPTFPRKVLSVTVTT